MWLLSQGDKVKVLEPQEFKKEIISEIEAMRQNYIKEYIDKVKEE
ncbi:MAG: hypothetical protein KatS3mg079_310 [Caloramator sp.]|nr:MAG: hypothetical protein KatS3mg079_310 [Caloramator sp.]